MNIHNTVKNAFVRFSCVIKIPTYYIIIHQSLEKTFGKRAIFQEEFLQTYIIICNFALISETSLSKCHLYSKSMFIIIGNYQKFYSHKTFTHIKNLKIVISLNMTQDLL